MSIEYRTEGKLTLQNATPLTESAVVMWVKDSGELVIRQGSHQVKLGVQQISKFVEVADIIRFDIDPTRG